MLKLIKSIITKLAQGILILSLIYAGSFVVMEETSEKSEKTEKSEEAIHSSFHSLAFMRSLASKQEKENWTQPKEEVSFIYCKVETPQSEDFNVDFIYYSSYLDSSYLA